MDTKPALDYLDAADALMKRVRETQMDAIVQAAEWCAAAIAKRGLVHLFGTGHSRMAVEEVFPRYGSFPGFHPMVELSMTNHTQVVGSNGQRQAMWIERQEGFGEVILSNFVFREHDVMIVFSTSGTNGVVVDIALGAKKRGMKVIAIIAAEYSALLKSGHSSGKKLSDVADLVIDNCAVPGDGMVDVPGVDVPVGPGSTIGNTAVVNALKCLVAADLAQRGQMPLVLASAHTMGAEASKQRFEDAYNDYRDRVKIVYGG
ncbi:sugar isomerase domain-containing protein [Arsenicitalea aurantiaca]|uniref:Sugar isomerase domain-containing protein n=1 Tax=Arsenicitalea aurantiaca TaxID=1783274 RepID=A0A433X846_9HYPH|nr:SIS domain-containing protein [Arsenicitalea aurantiaca]RUT30232.1 sugar isomerase domain-containing protein [Arsenicitalea aurantiaca]